jgi:protein disulfide isomerase family A protein 3
MWYPHARLHGFLPTTAHCSLLHNRLYERPERCVCAFANYACTRVCAGTQYWRNRVLKVASEFKRKLTFAVSDRNDFSNELEEYGALTHIDGPRQSFNL